MSDCIIDYCDYDLVKRCCRCGNISLKCNFHKNKKMSDGLYNRCKVCRKANYNENQEKNK